MARPSSIFLNAHPTPAWLMLALAAAVGATAGCQDAAEPNAPAPTGQADRTQVAAPATTRPAGPVKTTGGATRPADTQPAEAGTETGPAGEPTTQGQAFADQLASVRALDDQAEYYKALQMVWRLKDRYAGDRDRLTRLQQIDDELRDKRLQSVRFDRQVKKLGSPNPALRQYATREILQSGDLAFVLLRKAVRNQSGQTLESVADLLVQRRHWPAAEAFVNRLAADANLPQAKLLIDGTGELLKNAQPPQRPTLRPALGGIGELLFQAEPPRPYANELAELWKGPAEDWFDGNYVAYGQWLGDRPARPALLEALAEDDTFAHRQKVASLAEVYRLPLARNERAFNALAGDPNALAALRQYAARAASADRAELAEWAQSTTRALARHDYEALAEGLMMHWTFDEASAKGGNIPDRSGNGWQGTVENGKAVLVPGVTGKAMAFDGNGLCVDSPQNDPQENLHRNNYSLAVWVQPAGVPSGEEPDPMALILGKEGWHIGLQLNPEGTPSMVHYLQGDKGVTATGPEPLKPGTWYHLVGVVDRTEGRVVLYVNGRAVATRTFPAKAEASQRQDDSPIRLGAARDHRENWWCRYHGLADEVRVYNRALTPADVAALISLGQ